MIEVDVMRQCDIEDRPGLTVPGVWYAHGIDGDDMLVTALVDNPQRVWLFRLRRSTPARRS